MLANYSKPLVALAWLGSYFPASKTGSGGVIVRRLDVSNVRHAPVARHSLLATAAFPLVKTKTSYCRDFLGGFSYGRQVEMVPHEA